MYPRAGGDVTPPEHRDVLGAYELEQSFAVSEVSLLHRAQALEQRDELFVIKRLQARHRDDTELAPLFLRGARLTRGRALAGVIRTIAVHELPEPYIVMEHVAGLTLAQLLAARARDSLRLALPALCGALDGLHALHAELSVIHGAPSARHILVGEDGSARLIDLVHTQGAGLPWHPRLDDWLMPSEMAPEQVMAPAYADGRCDVFIVGAVLWNVLTGTSPFAAPGRDAALHKMLRGAIPLPSEHGSEAGRGFDQICMRALQRSRSERFASAQEMASAIREEARRARLWATQEEVATWVTSAAVAARCGALAGNSYTGATIAGLGPTLDAVRPLGASPEASLHAGRGARGPAQTASTRADIRQSRLRLRATTSTSGPFDPRGADAIRGVLDAPSSWQALQESIPPILTAEARRRSRGLRLSLAISAAAALALCALTYRELSFDAPSLPASPVASVGSPAAGSEDKSVAPSATLQALLRADDRPAETPPRAPAPRSQRTPRQKLARAEERAPAARGRTPLRPAPREAPAPSFATEADVSPAASPSLVAPPKAELEIPDNPYRD
jgi:serine/threonine-protein kinase